LLTIYSSLAAGHWLLVAGFWVLAAGLLASDDWVIATMAAVVSAMFLKNRLIIDIICHPWDRLPKAINNHSLGETKSRLGSAPTKYLLARSQ